MSNMPINLAYKCIEVISDYTGAVLTEVQFAELMQANPELNEQLIKFNSPTDTMDREDLMNAVSIKVTGRSWPTYGDKDDGSFPKIFVEGCIKHGYAVIQD